MNAYKPWPGSIISNKLTARESGWAVRVDYLPGRSICLIVTGAVYTQSRAMQYPTIPALLLSGSTYDYGLPKARIQTLRGQERPVPHVWASQNHCRTDEEFVRLSSSMALNCEHDGNLWARYEFHRMQEEDETRRFL